MDIHIDSESAITLTLGSDISLYTHLQVMALATAIKETVFPGLLDLVPAYTTLTVHFDPARIRQQVAGEPSPTAFAVRTLKQIGEQIGLFVATPAPHAQPFDQYKQPDEPPFVIPVRYGGVDGPDLSEVASRLRQTEQAIVQQHEAAVYWVFMIGFLPGFPYLGPLPDALVLPRRATPRLRVPAGSVAIAGRQTGIYPQPSPGGWHVIGRTDLSLFDAGNQPPALLRPGMKVKFIGC